MSQSTDIIETQIKTIETTELSTLYQLLGNADEIVRWVNELKLSTGQEQEFCVLMERMVKTPLRRQAGRLRNIRSALLKSIQPQTED